MKRFFLALPLLIAIGVGLGSSVAIVANGQTPPPSSDLTPKPALLPRKADPVPPTPPPAPPAVLAISGTTTVGVYTIGTLNVTGGTVSSVTWLELTGVLSTNAMGTMLDYTGPPGSYQVIAFATSGGSNQVLKTKVTVNGPAPTPTPNPPTPGPTPVPPGPTPNPVPPVSGPCPSATPAANPAGPTESLALDVIDPTETVTIDTADLTKFKPYINKGGWKQGPSAAATRAIEAGQAELKRQGIEQDANTPDYVRRNQAIGLGTKSITGFVKPQNLRQMMQAHKPDPEHTLKKRLGINAPDPNAPSFSWVSKGIVSAPHDQGQCGSCWDFSSAKVFSAAYALKYGIIQEPSEQDILNCDHNNGNGGCMGGNTAFDFLISPGAVCVQDMPYRGVGGLCKQQTGKLKAASWAYIDGASDESTIPTVAQIKQALCNYGPLWVTLDASSNSFASYSGGVFVGKPSPYGLNGPDTDHAVTLVGWDDSGQAWLVENSWGLSWGVQGFWWHKYNTSNLGFMAAYVVPQ